MSTAPEPWEAAIASYLHGERDAGTITALEIGLSHDPRCRIALYEQARMHLALTALLAPVDAEVYAMRVQQIIRLETISGAQRTVDGVLNKLPKRPLPQRQRSASRRPSTRPWIWPLVMAAMAVAVIGGWWLTPTPFVERSPWISVIDGGGEVISAGHRRPLQPGMALRPGDSLRSGPAGVTWQWVADGSRIRVTPQTTLQVTQDGAHRVIVLEHGRLHADIQPPSANVMVTTTIGRIVVEGTRFTATQDSDLLTVAVESGQVRLENLRGSALTVHAGQSARLHRTWSQPARDVDSPVLSAATIHARTAMNLHLPYPTSTYARFSDLVVPALRELGISSVSDGSVNAEFREQIAILGSHGIGLIWRLEAKPGVSPADQIAIMNQIAPLPIAVMGPFQADRPSGFSYDGLHDTPAIHAYFSDVVALMQADPRLRSITIFQPSVHGAEAFDLPASWRSNRECFPGDQMPEIALNELPWMPAVLNQTGYHTGRSMPTDPPGVSEAAAAIYMPRLWFGALARGVEYVGLYELIDWFEDPDVHWVNYGLIRADRNPKLAYTSVARLLRLLHDDGQPTPLRRSVLPCGVGGDTSDLQHLGITWADGREGVALWRARSVYDGATQRDLSVDPTPITLAFVNPVNDLTVIDLGSDDHDLVAPDMQSEWTVPIGAAVVVVTWMPTLSSSPASAPAPTR